jgi:hypothetical protein
MASLGPSLAKLRATPRGRSKLRVGVFADGVSQPRWLVESLARIATSDFAELAVLCVHNTRKGESRLVWEAYRHLDRAFFATGPDPLRSTRIDELVPPGRRLALAPGDPQWRSRIACLRLDVAVTVGGVDDREIEELARFGAWRHSFGETPHCDPTVAGLREVVEDRPVVASGIRVRCGGIERLACRSWSRTIPFSLTRSHERLFYKATDFLPRALRQLHEHGAEWLESHGIPAPPPTPAPLPDLGGLGTLGARVAMRTLEHCFTVGQWSLAYRFSPLEPWDGNLVPFHHLMPPTDRFWADPFPFSVKGRHYIFFEELPFATGKAHISVMEVDERGNASKPVRVLERDYHLSYPFLVEHDGALFMIPESAYDGTVQLFRCEQFPTRWKRERVLLEGAFLADATVHREGHRWWMFANMGSPEAGADDELHLFFADDLFGEWKPHPGNPVKSDVRASRPAGRLFRDGGRLYRPGQICAPIYGAGIALNRVTRLDEHTFAEEEERRVVPVACRIFKSVSEGAAPAPAGPVLGLHTMNRAGTLSVTDAFVRRRRF